MGINRGADAHSLLRLMGPAAAGLLVLDGRVVRLVGVGVDEDIVRVSLWVWRWVVWTDETPIKGSIIPHACYPAISGCTREALGDFFLLAFSVALNPR